MSKLRNIESILDSVSITHKFEKDKLVFLNTSDILEGKILIDKYMNVASLKGQAKKTIKNDDILYTEIRPKNKRYAYVNVSNPEDYVVSLVRGWQNYYCYFIKRDLNDLWCFVNRRLEKWCK